MKIDIGIGGEYRLIKRRGDVVTGDTGWFDNTITDSALNNWMQTVPLDTATQYCGVGVGTTAAGPTDSGITGQIGPRFSYYQLISQTVVGNVCTVVREYRATVSTIIGTITEVGLFSAPTAGVLATRALIKDGGGTPTSITLISGDTLYVQHRCTMTVPNTDVTGVITISGVPYNYVQRVCLFNSTYVVGLMTGTNCGVPGSTMFGMPMAASSSQTLGSISSDPGGTKSSYASTITPAAYTTGTFSRDYTIAWSIAQGNVAGGVGSLIIGNGNSGWQISLAKVSDGTKLPKDGTNTLSIPFTISVGR